MLSIHHNFGFYYHKLLKYIIFYKYIAIIFWYVPSADNDSMLSVKGHFIKNMP